MNDNDQELFEAELRKLAPARPPADLLRRLAAPPAANSSSAYHPSTTHHHPAWQLLLRWFAPLSAGIAIVALLVWRWSGNEAGRRVRLVSAPATPALKADDVELDQELIASFDAVARLPSGLPVRLRCREWTDQTVWRDSVRGIVVEQRAPRLEVVPVSFEAY